MKRWHYGFLLALLVLLIGLFFLRQCNPSESLAGIDANHDGVRDDLEKLIDEKWGADPKLRSIARQLVKTYHDEIEHPDTADEQRGGYAVDCLVELYPDKHTEVLKTIEAAAANTYARAQALIRFSARFNGKILTGSSSVQEACAFDPSLAPAK